MAALCLSHTYYMHMRSTTVSVLYPSIRRVMWALLPPDVIGYGLPRSSTGSAAQTTAKQEFTRRLHDLLRTYGVMWIRVWHDVCAYTIFDTSLDVRGWRIYRVFVVWCRGYSLPYLPTVLIT